jgi:hypothetical protein
MQTEQPSEQLSGLPTPMDQQVIVDPLIATETSKPKYWTKERRLARKEKRRLARAQSADKVTGAEAVGPIDIDIDATSASATIPEAPPAQRRRRRNRGPAYWKKRRQLWKEKKQLAKAAAASEPNAVTPESSVLVPATPTRSRARKLKDVSEDPPATSVGTGGDAAVAGEESRRRRRRKQRRARIKAKRLALTAEASAPTKAVEQTGSAADVGSDVKSETVGGEASTIHADAAAHTPRSSKSPRRKRRVRFASKIAETEPSGGAPSEAVPTESEPVPAVDSSARPQLDATQLPLTSASSSASTDTTDEADTDSDGDSIATASATDDVAEVKTFAPAPATEGLSISSQVDVSVA